MDTEGLKKLINEAFASVEYPGDWCLKGSSEGEEPFLLEREFRGKTDWQTLDPEFLDQAPGGFGSALSFFSDEAFRFYLPAYLTAHADEKLNFVDPVFYLAHGLGDASRSELLNPARYGARTWFQAASHRLSVFDRAQAAAIVAYLEYMRDRREFGREMIDQALANYWRNRANDSDTLGISPE